MKASGEPLEAERKLLDQLGAPVSPEALGVAVDLPPKSGRVRPGPQDAAEGIGKLLDDAGWKIKDRCHASTRKARRSSSKS